MKLSAAFAFILLSGMAQGQDREHAFEVNSRLGRGINMGNTFEAPTETAWGNPWKPDYFKIISDLGFTHVRVPIRWETQERSLEEAPFTINPEFLSRIQEVVDNALDNKLHVIINMHHHDFLFDDPSAQKKRFLSQWNQIAGYFKDYPDSLLFEVLNEPHGNVTPSLWNEYFQEALEEIRQLNPERVVLIGVAEYGGLGGLSKLQLPADEHLILTIHYYNPFTFTHQGAEWVAGSDAWMGTEWMDTDVDRQSVMSEFGYALQYADAHNIPIHVGEFGAYSTADIESRKRWTRFVARWFEEQNMSWAYWEFSAGFGIYDPASHSFVDGLVDALLHDEMAEPKAVFATPVYTSDFSEGADGWWLAQQAGAMGTLSSVENELQVSITNGGTEGWHLQLIKENLVLEQDKRYRLSLVASADDDRSATVYMGKSTSPWNEYSGYHGINLTAQEQEFMIVFEMRSPTDPAARIVIDMGTQSAGISISEVKVEALSFEPVEDPPITSVNDEPATPKVKVFPNPVSSTIRISDAAMYKVVRVYDVHGSLKVVSEIVNGTGEIGMGELPSGVYILVFGGNGRFERVRVVKGH